jgi:hypothetical protein
MIDEAGVRFPKERRDYSLFHGIRTDFGAHPASYIRPVTEVSIIGVRAARASRQQFTSTYCPE